MTRRSIIQAVAALPAALALKASAPKDVVKQSELQEVIDLYNRTELAAAKIRRRLEAGATVEHGRLGANTSAQASLEWFERNGGIGGWDSVDGVAGLNVAPVEKMRNEIALIQKYQRDAYWV